MILAIVVSKDSWRVFELDVDDLDLAVSAILNKLVEKFASGTAEIRLPSDIKKLEEHVQILLNNNSMRVQDARLITVDSQINIVLIKTTRS